MFHNRKTPGTPDQPETAKTAMSTPVKTQTTPNMTQTQTAQNQTESKAMNQPTDTSNNTPNTANRPMDLPGSTPYGRPTLNPTSHLTGYAAGGHAAYNPYGSGRKLIIGEGITLSGEIEHCDHLIVEGTVQATLKDAKMLDISESGVFYGTVEIEEATIAGRFEGDILVAGRLTVKSSGTITGSIRYKELAIEAGANIDGTLTPSTGKKEDNVAAADFSKGKAAAKKGTELPFGEKAQANQQQAAG